MKYINKISEQEFVALYQLAAVAGEDGEHGADGDGDSLEITIPTFAAPGLYPSDTIVQFMGSAPKEIVVRHLRKMIETLERATEWPPVVCDDDDVLVDRGGGPEPY